MKPVQCWNLLFAGLTGKGELSQRDVTVQAVVDETYADALGLHLHTRQRGGQAAGSQAATGLAMTHHVLHVLQQPRGSLVQLAYRTPHIFNEDVLYLLQYI